jgi:hypothetical protein
MEPGSGSPFTSRSLGDPFLEAPERSRCTLCLDGLSPPAPGCAPKASAKLLKLVLFSWPGEASEAPDDGGVELPESDAVVRTRFRGLLGDARSRVEAFEEDGLGRADRSESLTLDLKGVARGV